MMITFISQCEKKALPKTRRVLDAFANRIGDRTWQTVITDEGLRAVKKLLRKTASKNTAVSCHWIRSRNRTELIWVVGNRSKFNSEGYVPVNSTQKTIMDTQWEDDWHYLPLIKALTALAALFHDWGKASEFFQTKLRENKIIGDPIRHEWISTLFLNAFVNGDTEDKPWLERLANGEITSKHLQKIIGENSNEKPLDKLPNAASLIAWLVVSHHRLPDPGKKYKREPLENFEPLFKLIKQQWGYENKFNENEFQENLQRCFDYPNGLPSDSQKWLRYTKSNAKKLLDCLPLLNKSLEDGSWRSILHHARLALMLGDHNYSSQDADLKWQSSLTLYANTDKKSKSLKQKLDEHLVGVARQAIRITHLFPAFESKHAELQRVYDVKPLRQKSPSKFQWQDTAVTKITTWRSKSEKQNPDHFGFFAINMASTGKGKTFANAKIMRALSPDQESLRFILALGLRTLTLQTGDEYRERIKLDKDELAVLIGSRAVLDLHNKNKTERNENKQEYTGSESQESLLDNEIYYESELPEKDLTTVLTSQKNRQFLYAPVLSCTIDHLMAATETKRGGKYILPSLRLMSSDLVIDEIDDFDGKDLIAIGRLIHLAGMLGRKVMISSATIPPDLAEGYYNVYQSGWTIFAKMRDCNPVVACAWIDEFNTHVSDINISNNNGIEDYQKHHDKFTDKRVTKLQQQTAIRKANIVTCEINKEADADTIQNQYFKTIQSTIFETHQQHHIIEEKTQKKVSFGVVRTANISPCVELTSFLLNTQWPDDTSARIMCYHSQQVLLMRSEQEKHLDAVLKRDKGDQYVFQNNSVIQDHLNNTQAQNLIFILVATPVEEVGRDHDFDWAIVEPSSYRSIIQLAGRVFRHRERTSEISSPNIGLLQYNLKGLTTQEKPVYCRPGYETEKNKLKSHDLKQLVDVKRLEQGVDAQPRIKKPKHLDPEMSLADLEHHSIHQLLTDYEEQGPETMQGWINGCWWLTAIPQNYVRFRDSQPQYTMYLIPTDEGFQFVEKDNDGKPVPREKQYHIHWGDELPSLALKRLWLRRDYSTLLDKMTISNPEKAALIYGEIGLPTYGKDINDCYYTYSSQLGLVRKNKEAQC